jgi:hypothetical protein
MNLIVVFLINFAISIVMLEFGLHGMKPLYPTTQAHKDRDLKYKAFVRHDLGSINRPFLYLMAPFMLVRWVIAASGWLMCWVTCWTVSWFKTKGTPYSGLLQQIIRY